MKTKKKKKLIINADDFGLDESINDAIEIAHKQGILTNASLVVNGEAFDHAVKIAKRNSGLGVGLHLTLVDEAPVCAPDKIPSLVDVDGKFFENQFKMCLDILRKKVLRRDVVTEIDAQLKKFHQTGLKPTQIDSHQHLHLFPPIFNCMRPILEKYHIKRVRYLNIPWSEFRRGDNLKKIVAAFFKFYSLMKSKTFKHQDCYLGFFDGGNLGRRYILHLLRNLKHGTTEINFHPGLNNRHLQRRYSRWPKNASYKFDWEKEFSILVDPAVKSLIKQERIILVDYSAV